MAENKEILVQGVLNLNPPDEIDPFEEEIRQRCLQAIAVLQKIAEQEVRRPSKKRKYPSFADQQAGFLGGRNQAIRTRTWLDR